MRRFRVWSSTFCVLVVGLAIAGTHCHGPTEPVQCRDQIAVLENDPEYIARSEALTPAPGRLTKNCQTNARYCYYLGPVPVYTHGSSSSLDAYVDHQVLFVGKVVFPTSGSGELWAGTICRFE